MLYSYKLIVSIKYKLIVINLLQQSVIEELYDPIY